MKTIKIILISIAFVTLIIVGLIIGSNMYYSWKDKKVDSVIIPTGVNYEKPIDYLSQRQIDSIEKMPVDTNKILVVGSGYSGYDFYMWFKPREKGELYIKAYAEINNIRLSKQKLTNRTKNNILKPSNKYKLYKGNSVIYEGRLGKYYPARFELWFKSEKTGKERKVAEKIYLIDGWER